VWLDSVTEALLEHVCHALSAGGTELLQSTTVQVKHISCTFYTVYNNNN